MLERSFVSGIDTLVLAGGLGTRLNGLLTEAPKVLAPIGDRPFLDYLFECLTSQGITRVVLGLGYRAQPVLAHLQTHAYPGLEIVTVVEPRPLGTAGAVAFAVPHLQSDPVMVMNGDTFVEADLPAFVASHRRVRAGASVLCAKVNHPERFGRIEIDSFDRIARFEEKSSAASAPSWVNAGVYLFDRAILGRIAQLASGSLERDVLEAMPPGSIHACRTEGRFLDIGTPESLAQAAAFFQHSGRPQEAWNS